MTFLTPPIKSGFSPKGFKQKSFSFKGLASFLFVLLFSSHALAIDLSDSPLEATDKTPAPTVMIILDDSGSMNWEVMTPEENGTFHTSGFLFSNVEKYYIYPENPGDNIYLTGYLSSSERILWKSQWYGYNTLFYNPKTVYTPWPATDGSGNLPDADTENPRSDPMNPSYTIHLNDIYASVSVTWGKFNIRNSHYYLVNDTNLNGLADAGEDVFLVNISGSNRSFYRLDDTNHNERIDDNELTSIARSNIPEGIRPPEDDQDELQNFANWYSFYRRRSLCTKAALARTISGLSNIRIGFYSINEELIQGVLPVKLPNDQGDIIDESPTLLSRLYDLPIRTNGTNLREGLDTVGKYYMGDNPNNLGPSPFETAENGGECQRVYAIVMTDGYWSEDDDFTLSPSDPDNDGADNTLADVAMKYYMTDLRPDLGNNLNVTECNPQAQQHMVSFAVSFGVYGTLDPTAYDPCTLQNENGDSPLWPNPSCGACQAKIDDLWHAAANSKGEFFNASDPDSLISSLKNIFLSISNHEATAASVTVRSVKFYSRNTLFQGSYLSSNWTGDIQAYRISPVDGILTINQSPLWSAADELQRLTWENRTIISFDGDIGIPFTWKSLSEPQKALLDTNEELLLFLRGKPIEGFRQRDSILGDIVHSGTLLMGKTLYAGANDGMMHAFDVQTGRERFAYVPNLVFTNLKNLSDPNYEHKFFVDQTPVCSEIKLDNQKKIYLVGGLGKGGTGYYCLDITDVDSMDTANEDDMAKIVQWEVSYDQDLGYTFSSPLIVRTYSEAYPYVVLFGNGYNSKNGKAQLFIVDLLTGILITTLDTQAGNNNGMSTPIATDVNNDSRADYVYAGDLQGNLWKFDLTSTEHGEWSFSFKKNDIPAPLFKTAPNQSITTRPDVMRHCSKYGYMVCFGTGKYLGTSDLETTNLQAIYSVWDYGDDPGEYLGEFDPATQNVSNHPDNDVKLFTVNTSSTQTDIHADWSTIPDCEDTNPNQERNCSSLANPVSHVGWYLDLQPGERVHQDVHIRNNVLNALSKIPVSTPCESGGYSMIYAINPCSGYMFNEPAPTPDQRRLSPPTYISDPNGGDIPIYDKDSDISDGSGSGDGGGDDNDKIKSGLYFWQELFYGGWED